MERNVVPHRTTVLHKTDIQQLIKNTINLYTTNLLTDLTINILYINVNLYVD